MVIPTALSGRYRLEERLAGGGMGTVYAATDERLGRRVAIKLLKEDLADDPNFVERFRREARAVAGLLHPNIAGVFDYGEDEGSHYIVMELVEGRDLARVLREDGRLPLERALFVSSQLCDALGHAHATGIIHRDVKPANVIVGEGDHVSVTDFGIARAHGDATLTGAGSVLGTAQYMSPEQASGGPVGPPSDVYSAGVVLFELLTGTVPFTGDSPVSLALRHVNEAVPTPSSVNPGVPRELDALVARATAKRPEQRFADGSDMAAAVRRSLSPPTRPLGGIPAPTAVLASGDAPIPHPTDEIPTAWPARTGGRSRKWIGPVVALLVALALVAVALAAFTALRDDSRERGSRRGGGAPPAQDPPPSETAVSTVTVPEGLVGSNVEAAAGVLRESGLVPASNRVASEEEEGTVIDAEPDEGKEVPEGSTVTLTVSEGLPEESPPPDEGDDEGGGEGEGAAPGKGNDKGAKGGQGKNGKGKDKGD